MDDPVPLPPSNLCHDSIIKTRGHVQKSMARKIIGTSIWNQASNKTREPDEIGPPVLNFFRVGTLNG
jgi:hypothetical protein